MNADARSSRLRLALMLLALASIDAVAVLTSEVEGPGSAQFRVGSDATVAGLLAPGLPPGSLIVAVVAALALASAALALGATSATSPRPVSPAAVGATSFGRRRLVLGAGGAVALATAWAFRVRLTPDAEPLVHASAAEQSFAVLAPPASSNAVGSLAVAGGPATANGASPFGAGVADQPAGAPVPVSAGAPISPLTAEVPSADGPALASTGRAPASIATSPAVASAPSAAGAAGQTGPAVATDPPAAAFLSSTAEGYAPEPAAVAGAPGSVASAPAPTAAAAPPASAVARPPTQTMPGGRNNYVAGAPMVKNLGTGFVVSGTVLEAATGEPVRNTRIQIWLNTARGGEALASNRGSVLTDQAGRYRLDTSPVVPQFGQPHVHIAYDDGKYDTLFLRPVLKSERDASIAVDFILGSSAA